MKRSLLILLFAFVSCLGLVEAIAAPPDFKLPGIYDRSYAPMWGHKVAVSDSTTTFISTTTAAWTSGDESTIRFHTWGTVLEITCNLSVWVCVVMDDDVVLLADATGGGVQDAGVPLNGVGKCAYLMADADAHVGTIRVPIFRDLFETGAVASTSSPGYRQLSCSAPAAMLGRPCDNDDDCPTGGTCDGTNPTGAYAAIIADDASTVCAVVEGK